MPGKHPLSGRSVFSPPTTLVRHGREASKRWYGELVWQFSDKLFVQWRVLLNASASGKIYARPAGAKRNPRANSYERQDHVPFCRRDREAYSVRRRGGRNPPPERAGRRSFTFGDSHRLRRL